MPSQFSCPSCGRPLRMGEELVGQLVRCPGCNYEFVASAEAAIETAIQAPEERPPAPPPPPGETFIREGEPPPRPATRLPRFDDYEEDEFDEIPRRRRNDSLRENALNRVCGPANGLLAVGWIGIVMSIIGAIASLAGVAAERPGRRGPVAIDRAEARLVSIPIHIALSVLIIVGASKMKRLENLGLAKAAAIVAMIPCISPCCILGLPFGWQALQALNEPSVAAAFDGGRARID